MNHPISYHDVPRETFISVDRTISKHQKQLAKYLDLLIWWNKRVNLVSRSISRETLQQHIRHSLLLEGVAGLKKTDLVVDAGAGGGLPGIPLAIANPEKKFLLNDISTKKGLALKQIIHQLSLSNVFVQKCSIADIDVSEPFNLISKHAFKIDDLYQMVSSFCWRNLIFYKGVGFEGEIKTIESSLCINVYRLSKNGYSDFYNGKVIVKIAR